MTHSENDVRRLAVDEADANLRLDRFLARSIEDLSRQRLQALIGAGAVQVDGALASTASLKLQPGQIVEIRVPPATIEEPQPEVMPLAIVYEDRDLIVIDKPAGLVVHPAPGNESGTLVNGLLAHFGEALSSKGGMKRPGIVHRLDKDTSGLLVVAKSDQAHRGLSEQFASHGADGRMERTYLALAWGAFDRPKGRVASALGRSRTNRRKMAVVSDELGRAAATRYHVERRFGDKEGPDVSLLRLTLETGRTHQIRVHMASIGHPVLGDVTYGASHKSRARALSASAQDALKALGRQALHAAVLGFEHPLTGTALRFESPLPADMSKLIDALTAQKMSRT